MALVGPGMNRDAVCTEALAIFRCPDHVGQVAAPRIAQRGELVDVDGKANQDAKMEFRKLGNKKNRNGKGKYILFYL